MMLGLILHTCIAFSHEQYWLVSYTESLPWAEALSDVIHLFRMPLFFMLSGFFAFLLLQKQSVKHFCQIKLTRVMWPLVSVLVLVNIPQFYALSYLSELPQHTSVKPGDFAGHLWFLINLLMYFLVYASLHFIVARIRAPRANLPSAIFMLLMLLALPLVYLSLLALNTFGVPIYTSLPVISSLHIIFSYFDYFLMGVMFALLSHQRMMLVLTSSAAAIVFLPLLIIASIPWWLPSVINVITLPYIEHIQAVVVSLIIWLFAVRVFATDSAWFNSLANASYSIYLFHHGIIVALVFGLNSINQTANIVINPYVAFVLVLGLGFALSSALHFFVVVKNRKLRLMFNGK
jgi:glucan biosynthesis protein C